MDISFLQQTLSEVHLMAPTTGVIIAAVLAAILLLFSGFASGSEIAFFSLSPQDLSELNRNYVMIVSARLPPSSLLTIL